MCKTIAFRIPKYDYDNASNYCNEIGIKLSELVRIGLYEVIEELQAKNIQERRKYILKILSEEKLKKMEVNSLTIKEK